MKMPGSVLVPAAVIAALSFSQGLWNGPKNPPIVANRSIESHLLVPADVHRILRRSCYDCHTYQTRWPWYAGVPGISQVIQKDVTRARQHLNLSDWTTKLAEGEDEAQGSLNGICEELRSNSMPLPYYRWLHRDATVSPADVEAVCKWTLAAQKH